MMARSEDSAKCFLMTKECLGGDIPACPKIFTQSGGDEGFPKKVGEEKGSGHE
ncbi:hypothetical protein AA15669_0520 [Saccharibacter floricola DSM 15669]|uniref:Uncharacterized protein n=1 Tax=Saccharibacter floricola DSM 15669 TaxID=1123227 RepID=A0ABQ0NX50_9PROT|nr:hypothetical protein AA15669_0520 [Saccharibacter floricola DSM 15669]